MVLVGEDVDPAGVVWPAFGPLEVLVADELPPGAPTLEGLDVPLAPTLPAGNVVPPGALTLPAVLALGSAVWAQPASPQAPSMPPPSAQALSAATSGRVNVDFNRLTLPGVRPQWAVSKLATNALIFSGSFRR